MSTDAIVNKVANSSLTTIDLEELYHAGERVVYDIRQNLFQDLILKEKDFRGFVKSHDWEQYAGKNVAIVCTADAVVPTWAYMLLAAKLTPYANQVIFGDLQMLENILFQDVLNALDIEQYRDAKVVIKGCSKVSVPMQAYLRLTTLLQPVAASIMYGEPCSTVPIYKAKKSK